MRPFSRGKFAFLTTGMLVALLLSGVAYVAASDGFSASISVPISITGPDTVCRLVTNNHASGLVEYIPTASTAEWQSFVANPPAGVTLASCVPPCGGVSMGGYCWYLGATGAPTSCNSICATHNGCDINGLTNYVGINGSDAQCDVVLTALGAPAAGFYSYGAPYQSSGSPCSYQPRPLSYMPDKRVRYSNTPTGSSCAGPENYGGGYRGVCSCNN